jgi:hypothetical protein
MNSLKQWLKLKVWPWIAIRFFRLKQIEDFLQATNERYIDATIWGSIRGISPAKAARQLEEGVRLGYLERCLLYEWPDSPIRFVVPDSYMGRKVRLADLGYIGEDENREIMVSPNRVRKVFIAAEGGA